MLMLVPSVVSANGSCCTWALPAATAQETKNKKPDKLPSPAFCFPQQIPQKQSGTYRDDDEKSLQRMSTCAVMEVSINSWWGDECMNDSWKGGAIEESADKGTKESSKGEGMSA